MQLREHFHPGRSFIFRWGEAGEDAYPTGFRSLLSSTRLIEIETIAIALRSLRAGWCGFQFNILIQSRDRISKLKALEFKLFALGSIGLQ
jgi:hypothetical protein